MKRILLFAIASMALIVAQAQTVRFAQDGVTLENGATVVVTEMGASGFSMDWEPTIVNTSNESVEVILSVDPNLDSNRYPDMDALTMCSGENCFNASVTELPAFTLAAGEQSSHYFHASFQVMSVLMGNNDAYMEATYYIMNTNDEEDFTYVNVIFDRSKAAVDKTQMSSEVKVFQRGANLVCNYNFDTASSRNIVVSNIVGARVANVTLDSNNGEVSLGNLPKGVYVYTLVENGRNIQSRKIVVR